MIDFKFCEICSNHVPTVEVDGEYGCAYCYEAYGEINQAFTACRLDKAINFCRALDVVVDLVYDTIYSSPKVL